MAASPELKQILSNYDPEVQKIALAVRDLTYDVLSQTVEVPWVQQKIAGYGTGPKKQSEHFCWIQPNKAHVNLGFNYGAELPDPDSLLEGTGKLFRHIKMRSVSDVQRPGVRKLIEKACRHRVPAPSPEKTFA